FNIRLSPGHDSWPLAAANGPALTSKAAGRGRFPVANSVFGANETSGFRHKNAILLCDARWRRKRVYDRQSASFVRYSREVRVLALAGKSMNRKACPDSVPATRWSRALRIAFAVLVAAAALSACKSTVGTKAQYAADKPAGELYNKGLAYMNAGKMSDAVKNFNEVDRQHPYSEDARKALIMSAFASYRHGDYDDTVLTTQRYLTLYPGSPDAAYAQYLQAQSYFAQIPDVTRDQQQTQKALDAMQEIVTRYPDSEYVDDARKKILMARDQLAGKEMQIGR